MVYETKAGVPSRGLMYSRLCDHLREAQDCAAMLAHLHNTETTPHDQAAARGWLLIEEQIKRFVHVVTEIAKGNLS